MRNERARGTALALFGLAVSQLPRRLSQRLSGLTRGQLILKPRPGRWASPRHARQ
jgi:hypothetical protein